MDTFDSYDFGSWAMVKYPDEHIERTTGRILEYCLDKAKKRWPARTAEAIKKLKEGTSARD